MASSFLLEKDGRVATLIFNRPEKRNPLNEEVVLEFEGLLHQVRDDRDIRVLIVTGSGNTFSAGAAQFWFPEVDLGVPLSPDATALLAAQSGPAIAKEIIITCRRYTAEELLPMGLVNRVVKKEELYP